MTINKSDISKLREKTGAGILDCKKALEEVDGNFGAAVDILRKKGIAKAAKRAGKVAAEGVIQSYIHGGGKIGVLLELNCETDFVAKNDKFQELASNIEMHIAAMNPLYVTGDDVPSDVIEKEKDVYRDQLKDEGKPADIIEKILEGKINKYFEEVCLMQQKYVKDDSKTIEQLLTDATAEIGEKIQLRRFERFEVGEGVEKSESDFVSEVEEQMS